MPRLRTVALIAVGVCLLSNSVFAEENEKCPKGTAPIFEEDLQAAPSCAAAHAVHSFCGWGSTGDRGLAGVVIEKCEKIFLGKLKPPQKRDYDAKVKRCEDKADRAYRNGGGTADLSEGAMCEEDVAASYARDVTNAANPPTVKASFDCRKAQTLLELAICSNDGVGAADIDLSKVYRNASQAATPDARKVLVESERGWLDHVTAACLSMPPADAAAQSCVQNEFKGRADLIAQCMTKPTDARAACLNNYAEAPGLGR